MGSKSKKVETHRINHRGYLIVTRRDQRSNLWVNSIYQPADKDKPVSLSNRIKIHTGLIGKRKRKTAQDAAKEAVDKLPDMTPPKKEEEKNDPELSPSFRSDGS